MKKFCDRARPSHSFRCDHPSRTARPWYTPVRPASEGSPAANVTEDGLLSKADARSSDPSPQHTHAPCPEPKEWLRAVGVPWGFGPGASCSRARQEVCVLAEDEPGIRMAEPPCRRHHRLVGLIRNGLPDMEVDETSHRSLGFQEVRRLRPRQKQPTPPRPAGNSGSGSAARHPSPAGGSRRAVPAGGGQPCPRGSPRGGGRRGGEGA